jgi:mannitol-1-phosphate 5-dehydrogenase
MVNYKQIVIFGAGKIGRSFIGQLFGCSGYQVVFIDIDPGIITSLNLQKTYRVIIKEEKEEEIVVPNISAISVLESAKVIQAISNTGILAVSVGKNVLLQIIPIIAKGLQNRFQFNPGFPLDIILAENMRSASRFFYERLSKELPQNFPLDNFIGLVETSIGKMVPLVPSNELKRDPLILYTERYNTLILDTKGFKNSIPEVEGLAPKNNIKAWVDRKAFIHNLGHATAAYYGYFKIPTAIYLYEVLQDLSVLEFTRNVMLQSAKSLLNAYPNDFTEIDLNNHIDDLLIRFQNKALLDTVFRIGMDLVRKLGSGDRFLGSINLALKYGNPYDLIAEAMTYGFLFKAKGEDGNPLLSDARFLDALDENFESGLIKYLNMEPEIDKNIIENLRKIFYSL